MPRVPLAALLIALGGAGSSLAAADPSTQDKPKEPPPSEAEQTPNPGNSPTFESGQGSWPRRMGTPAQPRAASTLPPEKRAQARELYKKFRCATCHKLDNEGGKSGPPLNGVGKKDRSYLRESLIDPKKVIVEGYKPRMPGLKGRATDAEIELLLDYLETLE